MKTQTFTVTDEHVKLLRRFQVGWQDCETGAPEIDPKRPYGNSAVPEDIHEILTGESDCGSPLPGAKTPRALFRLAIHRRSSHAIPRSKTGSLLGLQRVT